MYNPFKKTTIMYNNIIPVAETRWPWLHKNFSGIPRWKQELTEWMEDQAKIKPENRGNLKIIFKILGHPILVEYDPTFTCIFPKMFNETEYLAVGWLRWTIFYIKAKIYYVPQEVIDRYEYFTNMTMTNQKLDTTVFNGGLPPESKQIQSNDTVESFSDQVSTVQDLTINDAVEIFQGV